MRKNYIINGAKLLIATLSLVNIIVPINSAETLANTPTPIYAKQKNKKVKKIKKNKNKTTLSKEKTSINNSQEDTYSIIGKRHWNSNQANVYLNLQDSYLINAAKQAIDAWNDTGAFRFVITDQPDQANIIINQVDVNNTYAGYTTTHFYIDTGLLIDANINLNTYYLNSDFNLKFPQSRVVNAVEHELGHAIGLQHTDHVSVMYPSGCYYDIQKEDIKNVKQLYHVN